MAGLPRVNSSLPSDGLPKAGCCLLRLSKRVVSSPPDELLSDQIKGLAWAELGAKTRVVQASL